MHAHHISVSRSVKSDRVELPNTALRITDAYQSQLPNTVRRAIADDAPPKYQRAPKGSIVDAVEPQIRELRLGIDVEVVKRSSNAGFHQLPKRWVIERTFGWLMQHRRLTRDYQVLPQRSRAMFHWAMANN